MSSSVLSSVELEYPSSDGKPMAESDSQGIPLMYAVTGLRDYFRDRHDVYVSGNLLIYYQEGNPGASVAPDVFVVVGVANHIRTSYKLWQEPKGPDFVLEITSRNTRHEDQGRKRELYRALGVQEYWQYDPTGDYLDPPLQGRQLVVGRYVRLPASDLADGTLAMASPVLGLELRISRHGLRFHDPVTGDDLPSLAESREARERAEQGRQRAEQEWRRAEQGRRREQQERQREQQARQAAEARVAELETLLRRRGGDDSSQGA